ncbi:ankyrin repeat domain-containing protein 29-like [Strongylocentrotus purpuratus]|uniref:Uncharacterized protein n=1 Tax=Strongylocentrotus purpuratus TaxID=7668 RepID=A0A7M7NYK2_STRPU|nr:ankyrin repeat domain-containing protein 29-like [Strongylocentrotus purpuratus]
MVIFVSPNISSVKELSQGAEVNREDKDGRTALLIAAQDGHLDVSKYPTSQGAEVNWGDKDGRTAVHIAANKGHLDITEYLLSQGSEFEGDELMYIHHALQRGHTSTIEKLVSKGADLNIQAPDGQTCLHKAIKFCYTTEKIVQETDTLRKVSLTPCIPTSTTPDRRLSNNKLHILKRPSIGGFGVCVESLWLSD